MGLRADARSNAVTRSQVARKQRAASAQLLIMAMNGEEWRLVFILAVPHALYAFIWWKPRASIALCRGADAVSTFANVGALLKGGCGPYHARAGLPTCYIVRLAAQRPLLMCARPVTERFRPARSPVLQFSAYYRYLTLDGPLAVTPEQWQWALFFLLGFCGQALNLGVYRAIGKTGVSSLA